MPTLTNVENINVIFCDSILREALWQQLPQPKLGIFPSSYTWRPHIIHIDCCKDGVCDPEQRTSKEDIVSSLYMFIMIAEEQ